MNRFRKNIRLLSHLLLWLLSCILMVSWIFGFLTDTDRTRKVTLFADQNRLKDRELAIALEESIPQGIRMIQVHSFRYALMDSVSLQTADLYVLTEAGAREHREWLCPLPAEIGTASGTLELDGEKVGVRIYSAAEGSGAAGAYLNYEEVPGEDWYLCFGAGGFHLKTLENGVDDAALAVAGKLTELK